jgi:hypothetical protein
MLWATQPEQVEVSNKVDVLRHGVSVDAKEPDW